MTGQELKKDRITVIMPLKDYHLGFLKKSVLSVTNQTCPYWNLLIIVERNDYSRFKMLLQNELCDPRIDIIVNQGRKLAGAVNSGMRYASTEFVAILLADDMWSNDAIEKLNQYIVEFPKVDFFHSSRIRIDEQDNIISSISQSKEQFSLDDFKRGSPVKHLLCWRRDKGLSIGGLDESLNNVGPDDYDFPWTMAENGATFKAVRECLYYYRNHCECYRLTTHVPLSVHKREVSRILKKHGEGFLSRMIIIAKGRRGSLGKQCIYRNSLDKWIKEKLGYDARQSWKQQKYE
jgi:glycosyltransferase involved in cell wall biosynthesis